MLWIARAFSAYCPPKVVVAFSLRIRRAVLEASLRSRKDFHTALKEFEDWLARIETAARQLDHDSNNTQLVKDAHKRRDWMEGEKVRLRWGRDRGGHEGYEKIRVPPYIARP
jgi:hypothetical protein